MGSHPCMGVSEMNIPNKTKKLEECEPGAPKEEVLRALKKIVKAKKSSSKREQPPDSALS